MRKLVTLVALALVVASSAGSQVPNNFKRYMLFNGSNAADSSERASIWIPVRGAARIYIRTWSAGANADTDFCDTVTTWKTMFSDSVLFQAVDSLGTIVTARSTIPRTIGVHGEPFPMCADSSVVSNAASDSVKMTVCVNPVEGVATPVRGSGTGSGLYTIIAPGPVGGVVPGVPSTGSIPLLGAQDYIMAQYMRIRITPRTRLTTAGFSSTAGIRTRGINRLKMEAVVVYPPR